MRPTYGRFQVVRFDRQETDVVAERIDGSDDA